MIELASVLTCELGRLLRRVRYHSHLGGCCQNWRYGKTAAHGMAFHGGTFSILQGRRE